MVLANYLRRVVPQVIQHLDQDVFPQDDAGSADLYELMRVYPLRHAKGLRPALCMAVGAGCGQDPERLLSTAAALELFHNAFLLHDDVEDGSFLRRHEPTLHVSHGAPVAINVGDGMLAVALEPLLSNVETLGLSRSLRILRLFAKMARITAEGQMMELSWTRSRRWDQSEADYLQMVRKKTSWYSFITPVLAGALAAGADAELLDQLEAFADPLGVAFQIQDDLLDFLGDGTGKERFNDLWEGKHTLLVLDALSRQCPEVAQHAMETLAKPRPAPDQPEGLVELWSALTATAHLREADRRLLDGLFASALDAKTGDEVAWLTELIDEEAIDRSRLVARTHVERARAVLEGPLQRWAPNSEHRQVLEELVDFVVTRLT